jgi:2Fe-2S ferredoxin
MPQITYITHDGARRTVDVATGMSVMRGAVANGVPGIDADCGGSCACGTCHVYVDPAWYGRLKPPATMEEDMLDMVGDRRDTSRLSCQIDVTAALDGLVVTTPARQG